MEEKQHPFRISNPTDDKIIEDQTAQTYVSGSKFEHSVPIPPSYQNIHLNSLYLLPQNHLGNTYPKPSQYLVFLHT